MVWSVMDKPIHINYISSTWTISEQGKRRSYQCLDRQSKQTVHDMYWVVKLLYFILMALLTLAVVFCCSRSLPAGGSVSLPTAGSVLVRFSRRSLAPSAPNHGATI
jgi:hypothetical protein